MSLWNHPRLTAALCTVAVLGCAAAPAVFLAAADAASLGRVETVADPYVAPTPTADDYYILRQLALCQRIAAAHGSALRIESEPGRGTRVSVTLPVWKEDAP